MVQAHRPAHPLGTPQARRSLGFIWPVAESQLYAEPKRLVRERLVEVREEASGPVRTRKVYRLTAGGRRALKRWLEPKRRQTG